MRSVLAVGLAIAVFALPSTAWAKPETFSAAGALCITGLPAIEARVTPNNVRIRATGEVLSGLVTSSAGWPAINGGAVTVTILEERSQFSLKDMTFRGEMKAAMTVATGAGNVTGTLQGIIEGAFTDPNDIILSITQSSTRFHFEVSGAGADAKGKGQTNFAAQPDGSFCGAFALEGRLR